MYLLECKDGSLYTGVTTDVARRFGEHAEGTASRYTRAHGAKAMRYVEPAPDRSTAQKREAHIKRMSRTQKLALMTRA